MRIQKIKIHLQLLTVLLFTGWITGCEPGQKQQQEGLESEPGVINETTEPDNLEEAAFGAELNNLNGAVKSGQAIDGKVRISKLADQVTITVDASSLPPNIMHLMHLHGFEDGHDAVCPPFSEADDNNDGVVDLIETQEYAGITMIPLHQDPVGLEIKTENYPTANAEGDLNFTVTFSMDSLTTAVQEKYGLDSVNFSNMVIFIHGVSEEANLPQSVASLPDVPARLTLPIACGELQNL